MLSIIKRLIPSAVKVAVKHAIGVKTMATRLANLQRAGFVCTGAVDVGAFHGEWARELRRVWQVPVLLVEPQPACANILKEYLRSENLPSSAYLQCALGRTETTASFLLQETNSRIAVDGDCSSVPTVEVPVRTLTSVLNENGAHLNLLKVDVQGFELDVLAGAGSKLQQFEVIILEVSVIRIGPAPVFIEVMQYMQSHGYRLYDFLPMYYRPRDNALWQGDAFFVRDDSALVASLDWA